MTSSIDPQEVEKFSRIADEWWSETGKFKPLHKFNPIRISYIRERIEENFKIDENLKILDVGCGGGLIAEPFTKMGANVTAIDASQKNIEVAKIHAGRSGLKIDYRPTTAEDLVKTNEQFDVVFALEIVEHVANVEGFIESCSKLVKPGGLLFIATINRTLKSLALAKIAVEYILHWLPRGTHDWKKFLKPSEINRILEKENIKIQKIKGMKFDLFSQSWCECDDINVNYMLVAQKK